MKALILAGMLALGAGGASAATLNFGLGGTSTNNASSFVYNASGVSLTVSGIRCADGTGPNNSSCDTALIDRSSTAIYMDGGGTDIHEVDGNNSNEFLKLTFNPDITLKSVSFTYFSSNDDFDLFTWTGLLWDDEGSASACTANCGSDNTVHTYDFNGTYTGSMFLIGATGQNDDWKLAGVSVDYTPSAVPLPAAGWMLVAGFAALAAMRRRKAA